MPVGQGGVGSGANNTSRYLGSALGVTIVSVVAAPAGVVSAASLTNGWNRAVLVTAAVSVLGALLVPAVGGRRVVTAARPAASPGARAADPSSRLP